MNTPPDPTQTSPIPTAPQMVFLRSVVKDPRVQVGAFSYYDGSGDPEGGFEKNNILYHFPNVETDLVIGNFCALANGCQFIMDGANHAMSGFSTFPFTIFGGAWQEAYDEPPDFRNRGGIEIGHDVWVGRDAVILAGAKIGSGSIIGAQAVVAGEIPPYSVVAGNPGKVVKRRFSDDLIAELLDISWWDWPIDKITSSISAIVDNDIKKLRAAMAQIEQA